MSDESGQCPTMRARVAVLVAATLCTAFLSVSAAEVGAQEASERPGTVLLDEPARGPEALEGLDGDLSAVATRNGMSVTAVRQLLQSDATAWVDRRGHIYYVDGVPPRGTRSAPANG